MVALAEQLGLELILGAFAAGAILNHLDMDQGMTHPEFRRKLAAVGFGVFIPVFFVTSGARFDLDALFASSAAIASILAFVAALQFARELPALPYRRDLGDRRALAAALLQATSLPFIVAATQIGQDLGLIDAATSAGFIAAGAGDGPRLSAYRARFAPALGIGWRRSNRPKLSRRGIQCQSRMPVGPRRRCWSR